MISFPPSMEKLINELSKLPSIGQKSATRLAYYLVVSKPDLSGSLASALEQVAQDIKLCESCFFLSEAVAGQEAVKCSICSNDSRDNSIICIVEKPMDVIAVERVGEFNGIYHVLHGLWSPIKGQSPDQIKIKELEFKLKTGGIKEIILATGSTLEGDATAMYLSNLVSQYGVKATRLAQGLPKGGELEYADEITLSRAFLGRNVL